jgi:hypothetical protein
MRGDLRGDLDSNKGGNQTVGMRFNGAGDFAIVHGVVSQRTSSEILAFLLLCLNMSVLEYKIRPSWATDHLRAFPSFYSSANPLMVSNKFGKNLRESYRF